MTLPALEKILNSIFEALEKEVSEFQNSPDDWGISDGNVAIYIIMEAGKVFG
jgi:hypothetical protein